MVSIILIVTYRKKYDQSHPERFLSSLNDGNVSIQKIVVDVIIAVTFDRF